MADNLQLIPVPQQVETGGGHYELPDDLSIQAKTGSPLYATASKELQAVWTPDGGCIRFRSSDDAPPLGLNDFVQAAEGYALVIAAEGIDIWACDPAGHFYGAMTLKQLIRQFGKRLPLLRIGDAPALRHRGVQIPLAQGLTEYRSAYFKHLVPILAGWKMNALYLYLESYFDFPSVPHLGGPGAMTAEDARELDALCKSYNIRLIPSLNVLGHCGDILALQKYHHLIECGPDKDFRTASTYTLCASSPEVRALVDAMLTDTMDCFSSEIICIGGDEVSNLGECPACRANVEEKGKLGHYADYFSRIKKTLNQRGRKAGLWGDMLIKHYGPSSDEERQYAIDALAEGTIIYDWHYRGGSPHTLRMFRDAGFETIACGSTNLVYSSSVDCDQHRKLTALYRDAITYGALGGVTTAWCNMYGLHEEQVNVLTSVSGCLLWSGTENDRKPISFAEDFERAYSLQRYGFATNALVEYWHALGDREGPVLKPLTPLNGVDIRKCLYHTDNVLMMWKCYSPILTNHNLANYEEGVRFARSLWNRVEEAISGCRDPYISLQSAPLLMHEHLLRRFKMTEAVYGYYDAAARIQYENRR
ncbi:family 20 glycosylhydrolase [Paenibacillus flagellatus]|uniref:beta-N-acetylhexosaminidase n=1 Tax=Paenibacillus flagellatus TaxID=2211139 RepID=A0A2V5K1G4_9BACL|nr:family 20 glycosylhydrolase [Paenibacillus flagellatus]PYI51564.1 hypothetical protein DLM86_24425 [Paenibacillus flagellatus]